MAFMIIAKDEPLYELDMSSKREDVARSNQFIIHAALDMVDAAVWSSTATYLKVVDRYNEQMVSAYVTPSGVRLMLLHDVRNEEGIRSFCTEVHELYVKVLLNPFHTPGAKVESKDFDTRVRALARRYLGYRGE